MMQSEMKVVRKTEEDVVMRTLKLVDNERYENLGGDVTQKHTKDTGVQREEAKDQKMWRLKTRCIDPK